MVYAWVSTITAANPTPFHNKNHGLFTMEVSSSGISGGGASAGGVNFIVIHGWLMWVAWGILGFV